MKKSITARAAPLAIVGTLVWLSGCVTASLKPEVPLLGSSLQQRSTKPDEAVLLVYNNSSKLMYLFDKNGSLSVRLDGKAVAQLDIGRYVLLQIPKGKHRLTLSHVDVFEFKSEHEFESSADPTIIEIAAMPVSNSLRVHATMPTGNDLPMPFSAYVPPAP